METIATQSGLSLRIETRLQANQIELVLLGAASSHCLLHWGVRRAAKEEWCLPSKSMWPPDTRPVGPNAVQTPFVKQNGQARITIRWVSPMDYSTLDFVLFFPDEGRWDNNAGRNYQVRLDRMPGATVSLMAALHAQLGEAPLLYERLFPVENEGQVAVVVCQRGDHYGVSAWTDIAGELLLHWGIARRAPHEWLLPPESARGPGTTICQENTAQTRFTPRSGYGGIDLDFPEAEAPLGLQFILRQTGQGARWIKFRGGNFYVPIHAGMPTAAAQGAAAPSALADEIIRSEMTRNSWTLMHRLDLCHDLLDRLGDPVEDLATLYVWLRFSAIRQLTWQRNYNTKPRELAHAQERLTQKLALAYGRWPAGRPLLRLMLATVGRGGEGQRIRDEILNIMHRHHLKEVSGHFLEEWHQKLHNNTTPDDVVICEAYLEFLRTHGQRDRFYQVLQEGGVTRQRLESFERPIRSHPDFVPHLRDGLLQDFHNFLKILKAAHSGTDLETAIQAARGQLDGELQSRLNHLWDHRQDPPEALVELVNQITAIRRRLSSCLHRREGLRELLYLDLALEQWLRVAVERNLHLRLTSESLADLITRLLDNVTLSAEDPELAACSRHWERLRTQPRNGAPWALHAKSVADRIARALGAWIDWFYRLLQPKAEYLGRGFQAEPWTIKLFSEEVVRGSSLGFVLSQLLRQMDPWLRREAQIGHWQIISRGRGFGRVEVVDSLRAIQRAQFSVPTIIVADQVMGDEEIPDKVTAVIAPDVTDVVSHVAVRARNAQVLFASCHDADLLRQLKGWQGRQLLLEVTPAGDVTMVEALDTPTVPAAPRVVAFSAHPISPCAKYAVTPAEFTMGNVGGKSRHQADLRDRLPDWIHLPVSVAIPFGGCEKVLDLPLNRENAKRFRQQTQRPDFGSPETLARLQEILMGLAAPRELAEELRETMTSVGLAWPGDWEKTWTRIKRVWASKWNERAFLSRQHAGLAHEALRMAVLIQQVAPADYAFVIHTVNPVTGNANELYAEVVLGLGETLVGNYPGRALGFVWDKSSGQSTLRSYPSKSTGLYGSGLIFRSDSNGEDLANYAGAGLYDSVLLDEPRSVMLDYAQEPLLWDEPFRSNLLAGIARLGIAVEQLSGSPQDIEGAMVEGRYYLVQTRPQVGLK